MTSLDFVIVGAQKAGTSALSKFLADVPGVYLPRGEVPLFESPHFESGGVDALKFLMRDQSAMAVRGIKRPNYLGLEVIPARISQAFPNVNIIIVLRDPLLRAVSAYLHYVEYSHLPPIVPEVGLKVLLNGESLDSPRAHEVLDWGRYRVLIQRYLREFDRERIIVIDQEELNHRPLLAVSRVPGVNVATMSATDRSRTNEGAKTLAQLRIRRGLHRCLTNVDPQTGQVLPRTKNPVRLAAALGFRELAKLEGHRRITGNGPFRISEELSHQLRDFYFDDVDFVRREFGIDLNAQS